MKTRMENTDTEHRGVPSAAQPQTIRPIALDAGSLKVLLAGAQARGMVEMLGLLGHGAILIDCSGSVLHVSTKAKELIDGAIDLIGGTLVGRTDKVRAMLRQLLEESLAGRSAISRLEPVKSQSACLTLRALRVDGAQFSAMQLAQVIITIESDAAI